MLTIRLTAVMITLGTVTPVFTICTIFLSLSFFFVWGVVVLGFELSALLLLSRCSTTESCTLFHTLFHLALIKKIPMM
jgi:hypothetical protein